MLFVIFNKLQTEEAIRSFVQQPMWVANYGFIIKAILQLAIKKLTTQTKSSSMLALGCSKNDYKEKLPDNIHLVKSIPKS